LVLCIRRPELGPPSPSVSMKDKVFSLKGTWETVALFVLVLGGIYFGVFTPTEGGGIGASGTILIALIKRQLSWGKFSAALRSTLESSVMIFILLIGAYIFGAFIARSELPMTLANMAEESNLNRYIVLGFIVVFYLIFGCFSDIISTTVLTIPIFYPVVLHLGFDPIWFGVVVVILIQIGLITPPIGLNVFIVKGVARDISIGEIFQGVTPFTIAMIVCTVILIAVPQISLFLPGMMK
jgi:C4-dicarboxylate transporter DctM subunit